jgi:NADH-quinone oxidoreductase subunit H
MSLNDIVLAQDGILNWFVFTAPLAFVIFFVSNMAEIGRAPFDLLEADSEIVAGYHIEYSGMKFGLFQATEFTHSFTAGALGGWRGPGVDILPLLGVVWFFAKTIFFYWVIMWIRLSVPRIRIDMMMAMNWKFMVPVMIVLLMITPILDYFVQDMGLVRVGAHLVLNVVLGVAAFSWGSRVLKPDRPERVRFPERPVARPPQEEEAAA